MLKTLPTYKDAVVVRTRDPEVLKSCDIVADVGGEYDASSDRYDHHQRTFAETMKSLNAITGLDSVTKLSSAGLVYAHFGKQVIRELIGPEPADDVLHKIYSKVYDEFVEEVDAIDNGVDRYETEETPRYSVTTTLSSRVKRLNPSWNEKDVDLDSRFEKAVALTGTEFKERVLFYSNVWLPARHIIESALDKATSVHESGEIMVLENGGVPWKGHLYTLEEERGIVGKTKYVLYTDQSGAWRVQCVSVSHSSFTNRLSLPEAWRGIRDDALSKLSGIDGCIFVHAAGFIGGNKTYEGVLAMAKAGLATQA